ncbi:hypothetical protein PPYR_01995 [Photinus pyralis]|uniref:Myosin motor domain-containing protein n=1 Tax=Photinus pyralis TaxID=7054 RepID=A0A5N4B5Z7_PHOPY|nr:unconventional myosin-Va isoform X2 [Photinus pyralis]KAB0805025.1 hypothetical protein PPYR_01995 [Photinus pyralis]
MTTVELYTKGTKVWIPHPIKVWEGGELLEDYSPTRPTLNIQTDEDKEIKTLSIKTEANLPHLRNPTILIGENDLTSLSYLHEPAVLYNLQVRFCQDKNIYTYCGIVLVAINPYDDLPIYDVDTIQAYRGQAMGDLDPHIFAVAEEAYTKLEREQRNQSIIVSGESGAGKTVSAKYTMRYFATVGGSATETQVEKKVLASSPIMEAIGNAKTTRNDNSSRFGKFIELQFNKQYHIIGASMRTYLLEKSRVVFQAPNERNYHIFYQLCAAKDQLPHLKLRDQEHFYYLHQGQSATIDGVSDLKYFQETVNALGLLGFTSEEQRNIFSILAAILHMGNIKFFDAIISTENEQDQEGSGIHENDEGLQIMSELLDIDKDQIQQWLCTKKIVSMRETILKPMSVEQSSISRDALAKHIYAELFNWIVALINKSLETDVAIHKFIGVLDIYGFETFQTNSFEQFCINYANEKLQQQFNLHVFKLEQEEYIKEEIEWKMIDFYDNQPCIDLIETKLGILSLLDEECKMPRGSDGSWTEKLYAKCVQYSHFEKARFGTSAFVINHFADRVQYESGGFLEKNRDTVMEEQINVIKYSKNDFIRRLFCKDSHKLSVPGTKLKVVASKPIIESSKSHKKSVGSQFRDSLNLLMTTLNATTPHYVRCIKPNDSKAAFEYNPQRAVQQLRACGVLETIRISAAGFPSRWAYIDFFYRYRVLCKFEDINRSNMKLTCEKILKIYIRAPDMYQFGKSKIFFRAGQVAYLEKLRADKLRKCCIIVQSTVRAFIYRRKYLKIKKSICNIQRYGRGVLARRLADNLRRNKAAITIQRYMRGWIKRVQYQRLASLLQRLQTRARGFLARRRFMVMKYNAKAIIIQKFARAWLARKHYREQLRHIIICQSAIRRFLARRLYKKLKIEARSIDHVKKLNKGLENKIISLQQKIEEINKNSNELKGYKNEALDLRNKLVTFKALEIEIKKMNTLLIEKNKTIDKLEDELRIERDEKMDLVQDQEKFRNDAEMQQEVWSQETSKLRKEIDNMTEIASMKEKGAEENLKVRIEQEKNLLLNEHDSDRQAYQKLLQEYHCLEMHCETLQKQLEPRLPTHARNISDLSSINMEESINLSEIPEDHGYGSVRSNSSASASRGKLDNIEWNDNLTNGDAEQKSEVKQDLGLILRLQRQLEKTTKSRNQLQKSLDELKVSPKMQMASKAIEDANHIAQLEVTCSELKKQLFELAESVADGNGKPQLQCLLTELERQGEEIVQLKNVLASQTNSIKSIVNCNSKTGDYINEDGELTLAYETQKIINKQLELELQDEKGRNESSEKELKAEIERLREDSMKMQRILSENLHESQMDMYLQCELTRITSENADLLDKNDALNETIRKLKKQLKILMKQIEDRGIDIEEHIKSSESKNMSHERIPSVRRKEKYLGMFSYSHGEEDGIMRQLVIDLKPRTAVGLLPGLPAYIVFMCVRHTDYISDENKVRSLLAAYRNSVRKTIKKKQDGFETMTLWFANTITLMNLMKQYSGDQAFQESNTDKQNSQCLRNFDLSDYRQLLCDTAVWIYFVIVNFLSDHLHSLIVPAILEHEEIPGISSNKPGGFRARANSLRGAETPGQQKPTEALLQELTKYYKILTFYGVDIQVISQIFKQIFYFICACSLNNLLLRKELCHWSKGFQVRHNLSHLEMWTREKKLDEPAIQGRLQPIIQAAHLLQARKTMEDVDSICDMCSMLSPFQISKILNLYTPVDDYEQKVPVEFIKQVQKKLEERADAQDPQTLLMDIKFVFPVHFPFVSSTIRLEDIEIPDVLKLHTLQKV